jgi:hypothetical protein
MSRPKSRQVATAGLVLRHPDGTCTRACRRCGQFEQARGWHAGLRSARAHAAEHHAEDARYLDTPWGIPAHELPPPGTAGGLAAWPPPRWSWRWPCWRSR